ncbi:SDR family oxidoreductase [Thiohalomonas denitrificans]|uniref:SDR family oxidoreductase n=1 Tax=Thiohalomonas denitrificans TaxID=415747 RepID=UPI0026F34151|nr:SDR family oxidoreductase [Thiohalomonas denitrificans]
MDGSKVVVVTGASAGIGRAAAIAFGQTGASVALLARGEAGLEGAAREVREVGGRALAIPTDVSDAEQVEAAAGQTEREIGPIDVWVNDAIVTVFSPVERMTADEYRRVTEVCYLGTVHGTLSALKRMRERNRGTIVQVGSALAYRGIPLQSAYCASKFAIRGFTESLRSELIHERVAIHVTMVQLSAFNTPQFQWSRTHVDKHPQPVPPIFRPELAARAIVWAAEHRRRELKVGWPAVKTIWGNKFFPALGDRLAAKQAWESQMIDETIDPDRPSNLYHPLPDFYGVHGRFSDRTRPFSVQFWLTTHRPFTTTVLAVAVAAAALLLAWMM